jgi:hypothetical protein
MLGIKGREEWLLHGREGVHITTHNESDTFTDLIVFH